MTTSRRVVAFAPVLASLAGAVSPSSAAIATRVITIDGQANERWVKIDATVNVPESWSTRPGQRAKSSAYVMYTDTYGPNNRWTWLSPKLSDDGVVEANALALTVQSKAGLESIEDFGAIEKIEPARAFGFELEGLSAADVVKSNTRTDKGGQKYYQWELDNGENFFGMVACVSGGALYAFVIEATSDKFKESPSTYRAVIDSFTVAKVDESRNDMSSRIYENR